MRGHFLSPFEFDPEIAPEGGGEPAAEPAAPSFSVDPDEWAQTQQFIQNAVPLMEDMAGRVYGQPDPYAQQGYQIDPNTGYDQYGQPLGYQQEPDPRQIVGQMFNEMFEERFGPMQPVLDHLAERAATDMTNQHIATLRSELGEFDQDQVVLAANGLIAQGGDPSQVFRAAATNVQAYEQKIRADKRAKVEEHYRTLSGAPGIPPAGGAAAAPGQEMPTGSGPEKYRIAVSRVLAAGHPTMPTG